VLTLEFVMPLIGGSAFFRNADDRRTSIQIEMVFAISFFSLGNGVTKFDWSKDPKSAKPRQTY
jgi:hypothetical protein